MSDLGTRNKINVLIVGSGGREHAIAWKCLQSNRINRLYVAPGNGGTREYNVQIQSNEIEKLSDFATKNDCFTIVGAEAPLASGIVDEFRSKGLSIFGPTSDQAKLETSKAYAKEFMKTHGIPTADFEVFDDVEEAVDYSYRKQGQVVVKADGLASGKGVFVCSSPEEAESAVRLILEKKAFGKSGEKLIIEEKLRGREASYMFLSDGKGALDFGTAVDHKRALDGDRGPNTGGMGAFSPAPELTPEQYLILKKKVAEPTIKYSGFRGFLYVGLMFDESNYPIVLEFNARLGDPETQAILPRLKSDLLGTVTDLDSSGSFQNPELDWSTESSCTVVMCSEGYPENPKTGDVVSGIYKAENLPKVFVFHSGTMWKDNSLYTNGGRVLSVTGLGNSPSEAARNSYEAVNLISWRGERHRKDISA
jgi:phosphoribosylamine--glycine ligase